MQLILFWAFALLTLVFGGGVVINRNPVASALNLVVSFLGLAALFMLLDAFFIGVIQVLIYAGAVMVLFLFIIMLFNLRAEKLRRINWPAAAGGPCTSPRPSRSATVASPGSQWPARIRDSISRFRRAAARGGRCAPGPSWAWTRN